MADGRLREVEFLAQARHVALPLAQQQQDVQAGLVRQQPEQSHERLEIRILCPATLLLHRPYSSLLGVCCPVARAPCRRPRGPPLYPQQFSVVKARGADFVVRPTCMETATSVYTYGDST